MTQKKKTTEINDFPPEMLKLNKTSSQILPDNIKLPPKMGYEDDTDSEFLDEDLPAPMMGFSLKKQPSVQL